MKRAIAVHEDFSREEEIKPPSDRTFGLTVAGALGLLALWPVARHRPMRYWALLLAVLLLAPALFRPRLLAPLNRVWHRFGLFMRRLVTHISLAIIFYGAVTPIGLLLRLMRRDLLRLQIDRRARTYWIERTPPGSTPETMRRQF